MQNLREAAGQALEALRLSDPKPRPGDDDYTEQGWKEHNAAIYAIRSALSDTQDWDEVEALRESLREHMAEIHRLRAAGRRALEALENDPVLANTNNNAMAWLRAALAEDRSADTGKTSDHFADANKMVATSQEFRQVEPVAYMMVNKTHKHAPCLHFTPPEDWHATWEAVPLYLDPPKRKPLTEEDAKAMWPAVTLVATQDIMKFVRAIERAHGIGGEE